MTLTLVVVLVVHLPISVHLVWVAVSVFVVFVPPSGVDSVVTLVRMLIPLEVGAVFKHCHTPFTVPQFLVPSLFSMLLLTHSRAPFTEA